MSEYYSWRWIFWFKLPLILLAIVLSWFTLADLSARRRQHRIDYPGALLMVGATVFLLLALAWGGRQHAWDSPVILGLFSASVVLGALFLAWQKRASEPLLPISILRNRIIVVTSIGAILITMVNMALSIYLPLYLQLCRAKTVGQAGVLLTAPLFGVVLGRTCRGNTCVSPAGTSCRRWWAWPWRRPRSWCLRWRRARLPWLPSLAFPSCWAWASARACRP